MSLMLALLAIGMGDLESTPEIPRSLSEMEPAALRAKGDDQGWWLGPRVGFIKARDADEGTWVVGGQVRWHILPVIAIEGSIEVRQDKYDDGDVKVLTIPIQVSGIVYLPVDWAIRPYAVGGIGWYVTRTHFSGSNISDDETTHEFGFHLGVGAEWTLSPKMSVDADFRYLWIDEPPHVGNSNFDSYEFTVGLNFKLGN